MSESSKRANNCRTLLIEQERVRRLSLHTKEKRTFERGCYT
jgi:hypothetical protein